MEVADTLVKCSELTDGSTIFRVEWVKAKNGRVSIRGTMDFAGNQDVRGKSDRRMTGTQHDDQLLSTDSLPIQMV